MSVREGGGAVRNQDDPLPPGDYTRSQVIAFAPEPGGVRLHLQGPASTFSYLVPDGADVWCDGGPGKMSTNDPVALLDWLRRNFAVGNIVTVGLTFGDPDSPARVTRADFRVGEVTGK